MRLTVLTLLAALCAVVTFALLYIGAGRNEMLIRLGWFEGCSVFFGALLFVAPDFRVSVPVHQKRLGVCDVCEFGAAVGPPPLPLLPSYGVTGAIICIPSLTAASATFLLVHLTQALIFSSVSYYVVQGIAQT
jgi:hypothetical protein